jgi:hypothetical protein
MTFVSQNGDGPDLIAKIAEFVSALASIGITVGVEISLRCVTQERNSVVPALEINAPEHGNFPPAAPAQPAAPQTLWRNLSREQRTALLHMEGRHLAKALGRAPTMMDWDAAKPGEYPTASGVAKYLEVGWTQLAVAWCNASA